MHLRAVNVSKEIRLMASYPFINFKINKDFCEWEQAFYSSQPMARQAGIVELFHGRIDDDSETCFVLAQVSSKEATDKFFAEAGDSIASSRHILKSTKVTMLNN